MDLETYFCSSQKLQRALNVSINYHAFFHFFDKVKNKNFIDGKNFGQFFWQKETNIFRLATNFQTR